VFFRQIVSDALVAINTDITLFHGRWIFLLLPLPPFGIYLTSRIASMASKPAERIAPSTPQ
jgi:hypothetical protein